MALGLQLPEVHKIPQDPRGSPESGGELWGLLWVRLRGVGLSEGLGGVALCRGPALGVSMWGG